jgi:DNA uptake protein ComE-like DNA-binding protein
MKRTLFAMLAVLGLVASAQTTPTNFPINLNTATDAEILSIPGIGNRMLREFKEYRPYTTIEQFRREIGKYVGAEQVAKWEPYVFVPTNPNTASEVQLVALKGIDKEMAALIIAGRSYKDWAALKAALDKKYEAKVVAALERYWVFK